jgi:beta-lactamase superfamily II metal-dependent hydrolase
VWNSLGSLPDPKEIEVTVIGPGYGESVVVHLGDGQWLIVDSCVDTVDPQKPVAPLKYLRGLGVDVKNAVILIVASHWDDDHVKGIGDVVEACPNARFVCSKIFPEAKFLCLVEALSIGSAATDGASVRNIRKVVENLDHRGQTLERAVPGKKLLWSPAIHSWSPSDHDDTQFLYYVAQLHPKAGQPLRKAVVQTGNITSIVLSIDWLDTSVLLGADMEVAADSRSGWQAAFAEIQKVGSWTRGSFVKVPHHGSHTGHFEPMWDHLLHPAPISVVAPFGKGRLGSRPPKSSDVRRISDRSGSFFLTARQAEHKPAKKEAAVVRSLREGSISITSQKTPIGMVRHRRKEGGHWSHELFGAAVRVR